MRAGEAAAVVLAGGGAALPAAEKPLLDRVWNTNGSATGITAETAPGPVGSERTNELPSRAETSSPTRPSRPRPARGLPCRYRKLTGARSRLSRGMPAVQLNSAVMARCLGRRRPQCSRNTDTTERPASALPQTSTRVRKTRVIQTGSWGCVLYQPPTFTKLRNTSKTRPFDFICRDAADHEIRVEGRTYGMSVDGRRSEQRKRGAMADGSGAGEGHPGGAHTRWPAR